MGLVVSIANFLDASVTVSIYVSRNDVLDDMFGACTTSQINEFIPEKRGFRIHGHSTSISLERAYWEVLDEMAREAGIPLSRLIEKVHDGCLVANDRNIASCMRVICLKYLNVYRHNRSFTERATSPPPAGVDSSLWARP
jgi:predicted DNA-binding ribbon-helix-helix protein